MVSQRVLIQILQDLNYKKHTDNTNAVMCGFRYGRLGNGFWVQHWQMLRDCTSEQADSLTEQKGRKWYISRHCSISEIVQTCLMAVLAFEEHEAREGFTFKGERPFGPHVDVEALMDAGNYKDIRG